MATLTLILSASLGEIVANGIDTPRVWAKVWRVLFTRLNDGKSVDVVGCAGIPRENGECNLHGCSREVPQAKVASLAWHPSAAEKSGIFGKGCTSQCPLLSVYLTGRQGLAYAQIAPNAGRVIFKTSRSIRILAETNDEKRDWWWRRRGYRNFYQCGGEPGQSCDLNP